MGERTVRAVLARAGPAPKLAEHHLMTRPEGLSYEIRRAKLLLAVREGAVVAALASLRPEEVMAPPVDDALLWRHDDQTGLSHVPDDETTGSYLTMGLGGQKQC